MADRAGVTAVSAVLFRLITSVVVSVPALGACVVVHFITPMVAVVAVASAVVCRSSIDVIIQASSAMKIVLLISPAEISVLVIGTVMTIS